MDNNEWKEVVIKGDASFPNHRHRLVGACYILNSTQ